MTRRDFLMKWLLYAAVTLLLVLLQSLVLTHIHLLDIHPFALPLLAGIIAVWEPQRECAFYGLVFGLVCDLTMPAAMPCLYTLSFLIAGLLVNFIARKLIMPGFWCSMVGAALALDVQAMEAFLPDQPEEIPMPDNVIPLHRNLGAALGIAPDMSAPREIVEPRIYVAGKAPVQQAMIDVLEALGHEGAIAVPRELSARMGVTGAAEIGL